jgi:hypothetical protein
LRKKTKPKAKSDPRETVDIPEGLDAIIAAEAERAGVSYQMLIIHLLTVAMSEDHMTMPRAYWERIKTLLWDAHALAAAVSTGGEPLRVEAAWRLTREASRVYSDLVAAGVGGLTYRAPPGAPKATPSTAAERRAAGLEP